MDLKDIPQWIAAFAAVVSAGGVILAYYQLRLVKGLAQNQFEDALAREYRELAGRLPTKALLGEALTDQEHEEAFDEFLHYIDLSNEQVFLRQERRISAAVWRNWCAGIRTNLERPAFERAWRAVKERCTSFEELRRLETEGFASDPAMWGRGVS